MNGRAIDQLTLEQYILGELPPDDLRAVESAVEGDASLRARIDAIKESNAAVLKEYPAEYTEGLVIRKLNAARRLQNRKISGGARVLRPVFAAALVFATAGTVFLFNRDYDSVKNDKVILKGDAAKLSIFKKSLSGPELLRADSAARENDLIQIAFRVPAGYYACIISVDSRGSTTQHYPAGNAALSRCDGKEIFLPNSYQLDDAPGSEIFYLAASKEIFSVNGVKSRASVSAEKLSPLEMGDKFSETFFVLRKGDK